jgi:hypothetical protein
VSLALRPPFISLSYGTHVMARTPYRDPASDRDLGRTGFLSVGAAADNIVSLPGLAGLPASKPRRAASLIAQVLSYLREQATAEGPPPRLPSPPASSEVVLDVHPRWYIRFPDDAA